MQRLRLWLLSIVAGFVSAASVPTPEGFFGHRMGEDRKIIAWDRVVTYFEELDRASDRVLTETLGPTTEGRPLIAVTIASPEVLARLAEYQQIQKQLADPRRTPPELARTLIERGRVVVMITCSIHSTELASTQTAIEFAYRMASGQDWKTSTILREVIFILVPSLNPDGLEIVRRWYEGTLGTPFEGTSPPELYHKYTGHDNNRDWYMFTQQETRLVVEKLHNRWHPQIVYDVHQQGPYASRMFVPPWTDPIDPNVDPILIQLSNMIGMGMAADLTRAGKRGVVVNAIYDFWTPARHYQAYHGGMRILSETASARLASPIEVKPEQIPPTDRGYRPREPSWNYVEPWLGGTWRLRDIVEYQLIAWESCLYQAAVRRRDLLEAFYRVGQRATARSSPYAFVIPYRQWDPSAAKKLLETLAFGLVEIERATGAFQAAGQVFPQGTYVIRMQQPYSSFAKTLLERQRYPDLREYPDGPPQRPYDVTAHTLPLLMGVEVHEVAQHVSVPLQPALRFDFSPLTPVPAGAQLAADIGSWRWVTSRWRQGQPVYRDPVTGDFYGESLPGRQLVRLAEPRIGVYRSWIPVADEGWTRWVLEQFGFRYRRLTNADLLAGQLRGQLDVIVFPDQTPVTIERGYRPGEMPEEFVGGLGERGAEILRQFVGEGGVLVFLNRSARWATQRLVPAVEEVTAKLPAARFYCPGSLLWVTGTRHPLLLGLPDHFAIWHEYSPVWNVPADPNIVPVLRYPPADLLASGWLLGGQHIAGKAALLEIRLGKGRVILFGFRPQYRGQSYQTFKIFFNAVAGF